MTLVEIIFLCVKRSRQALLLPSSKRVGVFGLKKMTEGNQADLFLLSHRLSCFQHVCNNKTALQFGRVNNKLFYNQKSIPLSLNPHKNTLNTQEKCPVISPSCLLI